MMNDWYCVLFSIVAGALTQAQRDALDQLQAYYELVNTRNGRWYVDICGPRARLQALRDYLTAQGRDPKVIGIFQHNDATGTADLAGQFDAVEYQNVAPDVRTYNAAGVLTSSVRPVGFVDVHQFGGWGVKTGTP